MLIESLKGRDCFEDVGKDGRKILNRSEVELEGVDWICLAQDLGQ
jgi:hypothetical protein